MRPAVLSLIFAFLLVACSPSSREGSGPELDRAYALADSLPDSALSVLDSLRRVSGLRESPRAGYIRARALLAERDYAGAITEALSALEAQREGGDRDAALLSSDLVGQAEFPEHLLKQGG